MREHAAPLMSDSNTALIAEAIAAGVATSDAHSGLGFRI